MRTSFKYAIPALFIAGLVAADEISDLSTTDASNTVRWAEGMARSAVNNSARAMEGYLARWYKDTNGSLASTGSSNTYAVAANQTISAYFDGLKIVFEANHTNTGAATLNVDTVGAATISKYGAVDLEANDIASGQKYEVIYDGARWQLVNSITPFASTVTSGNIPLFSGTTGKFTDSGYTPSTIGAGAVLTTEGDILYQDGSGLQRLAAGAATRTLRMNSGATAPEWVAAITPGTAQTVSGTTATFSSLPSGAVKIVLQLVGVSTNGTSPFLVNLGDSGGVEATGYLGSGSNWTTSPNASSYTQGCGLSHSGGVIATGVLHGTYTFTLVDSANNTWIGAFVGSKSDTATMNLASCSKSLSGTLDRITLSTEGGSDTFDAGTVNVLVFQ